MTNPTIPPTGGMPKWVIVLLVIFIVIILGCCGGFAMCHWMCTRVATTVGQAIQDHGADWVTQAQNAAAKANAAQQVRAAAQGQAGAPGVNGGTVTPNPENAPTNGGEVSMPANFPTDLPAYKGLTPALSNADNLHDAGNVVLRGSATKADVQNFYRAEMKKQGWTSTADQDLGELSQLGFEKDTRTALVQIVPDKDKPGQITVNITYAKK